MDVRGWLIFIRDWLLVLLIGTAVAGAAAFGISSLLPKTYEAEATLLVGQSLSDPNADYESILTSQQVAQTYAAVGTSRDRLERVIADLSLDTTPEELAASVEVRAPANSTLLVVAAQSSSPSEAAAIANSLAAVLVAGEVDEIEDPTAEELVALQVRIDDISADIIALLGEGPLSAAEEARLAQLEEQRNQLRTAYDVMSEQVIGSASQVTLVEPASIPTEPVSPRILLNTLLGAVIGLLITTLVVYAFDATERRYDNRANAAAAPPMATPRYPTG